MKITLKEILEALSHESLSFMADSNHANGTIAADQIPKIIGRVNGVIRKLAVKFVLKEKMIRVNVSANRRYYTLNKGDAWIIEDPLEPFENDVSLILGIETPDGRMHPIGDKASFRSILLRDDGNAFAMDTHLPNGIYTIYYKAKTPQFEIDPEKLDQVLEIPEALLNALYEGVAAVTYEGLGGAENVKLAIAKWQKFEQDCSEAKINSAVNVEETDEGNKFGDRGFR